MKIVFVLYTSKLNSWVSMFNTFSLKLGALETISDDEMVVLEGEEKEKRKPTRDAIIIKIIIKKIINAIKNESEFSFTDFKS